MVVLFSHEMLTAQAPSDWMIRHAPRIAPGGKVLDLACGAGRNTRWMAQNGWQVLAVDRDEVALQALRGMPGVSVMVADLEAAPWPFEQQHFDGIVVCRYLHRPLLPLISASLKPGGILIYETFMQGQERLGRPTNPDFLLQPDELAASFSQHTILAFEQGFFEAPQPAMMQRICSRR